MPFIIDDLEFSVFSILTWSIVLLSWNDRKWSRTWLVFLLDEIKKFRMYFESTQFLLLIGFPFFINFPSFT